MRIVDSYQYFYKKNFSVSHNIHAHIRGRNTSGNHWIIFQKMRKDRIVIRVTEYE